MIIVWNNQLSNSYNNLGFTISVIKNSSTNISRMDYVTEGPRKLPPILGTMQCCRSWTNSRS